MFFLNKGRWLADYFDDAGYWSWHMWPQLYKAMIINAFPPIKKLEGESNVPSEIAALDLEEYYVKFLAVSDQHLAMAQFNTAGLGALAKLPFIRQRAK